MKTELNDITYEFKSKKATHLIVWKYLGKEKPNESEVKYKQWMVYYGEDGKLFLTVAKTFAQPSLGTTNKFLREAIKYMEDYKKSI